MQGSPEPSDAVIKILGQALVDADLRKKLSGDAFATGKDLGLLDDESKELEETLNKMPPGSFDALAEVCRAHLCFHGFCPR